MSVWYQDTYLAGSLSGAAGAAATKAGLIGTLQMDALGSSNPSRALDNYSLKIGQTAAGGTLSIGGCAYPGASAGTPTYQAIDTTNGPYVSLRTLYWQEMPVGVNVVLANSTGYAALGTNPGSTGAGLFSVCIGGAATSLQTNSSGTAVAMAMAVTTADTSGTALPGELVNPLLAVSGATFKEEVGVALVIRGPVLNDSGSPIADLWWCEAWVQSQWLCDVDSPDWFCMGVGQCSLPGGTVPITAFLVASSAEAACYVHVVDQLWGQDTTYQPNGQGQTEPPFDPAILSRHKVLSPITSLYHSAANTPIPYWVSGANRMMGAARTASGTVVVACCEGLTSQLGDARVNLYRALNPACSAWSPPALVFPLKTQPGIQLSYNSAGHTGYYTITNSATAATRYLNLFVDGTDTGHRVAQITLGTSTTLTTLLTTIGGYAGWSAIIDPAAGTYGGGNASAWGLVEQLTATVVPASGVLIPVQWALQAGRLIGRGNTLLVLAERVWQTTPTVVSDLVQTLSTDGGVTWSAEATISGQVVGSVVITDVIWSAHQQCWIAVGTYGTGSSFQMCIYKSISSNGNAADKSQPVLASDWSLTLVTPSYGSGVSTLYELTLAEADDGTLLVVTEAGNYLFAPYSYSTDGGATWSAFTQLDGSYSSGVQVRSPVWSSNTPLNLQVVGGYLWILGPNPTAEPSGFRNSLRFYRSKTPINASTLATGLLVDPVLPGTLIGTTAGGTNIAFPKWNSDGAAALIVYSNASPKRLFYDPNFFGQTVIASLPPANEVLSGVDRGDGVLGTRADCPASEALTTASYGDLASPTTGTVTEAATTDVRHGTQYGAGGTAHTGSAYIPAAGDVRVGVNVDATVGVYFVHPTFGVRTGTY